MPDKLKFVISLYSPIGGQGVTFAAVQLAHQLAKFGPTCLLDLNLDKSVSLLYLKQDAQEAFRKSALATDEESSKISNFAIKVEDNYFAIGVPLLGYGHFAEDVDEALKELFEQSRAEFDFTIIDLPHPLHVELSRQALLKSDLAIYMLGDSKHATDSANTFKQLLGNQKMNALKGKEIFVMNHVGAAISKSWLAIDIFKSIFFFAVATMFWIDVFKRDNTALIVLSMLGLWTIISTVLDISRYTNAGKAGMDELKRNKIPVFHEMPNDPKACLQAINESKFLDDNSPMGKSLLLLTQKIRKRLG